MAGTTFHSVSVGNGEHDKWQLLHFLYCVPKKSLFYFLVDNSETSSDFNKIWQETSSMLFHRIEIRREFAPGSKKIKKKKKKKRRS